MLTEAIERQESASFLKKRSKKLLFSVAKSALKSKSFLVLFFKKEHSCLLSVARVRFFISPVFVFLQKRSEKTFTSSARP
jgi:hypothetical protein